MTTPKQGYPFRLATTSFIYPADYITNVHRLAHRVDEVELLFFESRPDALPSEAQIGQLAAAAAQAGITYNVHLPLDLDLASAHSQRQAQAIRRMADIIRLAAPLHPTTHTLHLTNASTARNDADIIAWQSRATEGTRQLLVVSGINPRRISIETLNYPPQWLTPVVDRLDLAVCLDVGHVLRYGFDLEHVLSQFSARISILHLHALVDGKDHHGLNRLDMRTRRILLPFLSDFRGSVSIEVFSLQDLDDSLPTLARMMAGEVSTKS